MPTSIKAIAERLNMGKSTVQRALSGKGCVDEKKKALIIATAQEMGAQRDIFFSSLVGLQRKSKKNTALVYYVHRDVPRADARSKSKNLISPLREFGSP